MGLVVRTLVLAAVVLLAGATPALAKSPLLGKWRMVSMSKGGKTHQVKDRTAVIEFKDGGVFITQVTYRGKSRSDQGTWQVKGDTLTTVMRKVKEVLKYQVEGGKLRLTHTKRKGMMILERF